MTRLEAAKDLLTKTLANWSEDNVPRLAAAFSFYAALSIAPLLVFAVTVASSFLRQGEAERELLAQVRQFVGSKEAAEFVRTLIENTHKGSTSAVATALSFLVTFFSASNLFLQLNDAANSIWGIKQTGSMIRNIVLTRVVAFLSAAVFGLFVLGWLGVSTWLGWLSSHASGFGGWRIVNLVVAALFFTGALGIAYKGMPKGRVAWHDVWPGAVVGAVGIALSQTAFSLYFQFAKVSAAYGAAGALVVILLWIYYSSQIFFFGLEVTYTYAKEFGSLKGQSPGDLEYS